MNGPGVGQCLYLDRSKFRKAGIAQGKHGEDKAHQKEIVNPSSVTEASEDRFNHETEPAASLCSLGRVVGDSGLTGTICSVCGPVDFGRGLKKLIGLWEGLSDAAHVEEGTRCALHLGSLVLKREGESFVPNRGEESAEVIVHLLQVFTARVRLAEADVGRQKEGNLSIAVSMGGRLKGAGAGSPRIETLLVGRSTNISREWCRNVYTTDKGDTAVPSRAMRKGGFTGCGSHVTSNSRTNVAQKRKANPSISEPSIHHRTRQVAPWRIVLPGGHGPALHVVVAPRKTSPAETS